MTQQTPSQPDIISPAEAKFWQEQAVAAEDIQELGLDRGGRTAHVKSCYGDAIGGDSVACVQKIVPPNAQITPQHTRQAMRICLIFCGFPAVSKINEKKMK